MRESYRNWFFNLVCCTVKKNVIKNNQVLLVCHLQTPLSLKLYQNFQYMLCSKLRKNRKKNQQTNKQTKNPAIGHFCFHIFPCLFNLNSSFEFVHCVNRLGGAIIVTKLQFHPCCSWAEKSWQI